MERNFGSARQPLGWYLQGWGWLSCLGPAETWRVFRAAMVWGAREFQPGQFAWIGAIGKTEYAAVATHRLHADAPEFNPNQPAWAPREAEKATAIRSFSRWEILSWQQWQPAVVAAWNINQ
eukprot:Skav200527  [mRNA]  locus=scaffold2291:77262:78361:- [translate_table: standard]